MRKRGRGTLFFSGAGDPAAVADEKRYAFAALHYAVFGFAEGKMISMQ